jgi:hypothetical protein
MKSRPIPKNQIKAIQKLQARTVCLYTSPPASWKNLWNLFGAGRKKVEAVIDTVGYIEYTKGRSTFFYRPYGEHIWRKSKTKQPVGDHSQTVLNTMKSSEEPLLINVTNFI